MSALTPELQALWDRIQLRLTRIHGRVDADDVLIGDLWKKIIDFNTQLESPELVTGGEGQD